MRKTGSAIVNDVYELMVNSPIPSFILGKVYKHTRPTNSEDEDCTIRFKTGLDNRLQDGNTQSGAVTINIYVPFIDNGSGTKVPNTGRIHEIETFIEPIIRSWSSAEYLFSIGDMIQSFEDNSLEQSFIYVDLRFIKSTIF